MAPMRRRDPNSRNPVHLKLRPLQRRPSNKDSLNCIFRFPPYTSTATKDFLQDYKHPTHIDLIPDSNCIRFIFSNTMKFWNKRRESTCTYRQHVGHYQVITRHNALSWFFFQRGEISSLSGYPPKNTVNVQTK